MTDLDEAKELLMTLTKQGVSTEPTSLHRAVMLLLMDYIQRRRPKPTALLPTFPCQVSASLHPRVPQKRAGYSPLEGA